VVLCHWCNLHAPKTLLKHADNKHITRATLNSTCRYFMVVPGSCPSVGIIVDLGEIEMLQQPKVSAEVNVKPVSQFKIIEKLSPFATKPCRDIAPEALDPYVMHAPVVLRYHPLE